MTWCLQLHRLFVSLTVKQIERVEELKENLGVEELEEYLEMKEWHL